MMQPYQPAPQQYRPRRRKSRARLLLIIAGSVIGALVVIGAAGAALAPHAHSGGSPSRPARTSSPAAGSKGHPAAHPAAKAKAAVLATFSGSGDENTPKFTVSGSWKLKWSYNCSSQGFAGNFIVMEDNGFSGLQLNQEGKKGHGFTWSYNDSGRHFLAVNSECKWAVKVVGTR
jgi:hypothetical protein